MFNINFNQLIQFLLPINWRKQVFVAWLKLILSHLNKVYTEFNAFRTLMLYNINFTGQIIYLEKMMNDTFEVTGIYISDVPGGGAQFYLFNTGEDFLPVYIGNLFEPGVIYNEGDWVVYDNYWFEYIAIGNGSSPIADTNAINRGEIETLCSNADEMIDADFIVNIPVAVFNSFSSDDILKLRKLIEYYKLAEMRYIFKTY